MIGDFETCDRNTEINGIRDFDVVQIWGLDCWVLLVGLIGGVNFTLLDGGTGLIWVFFLLVSDL